jgi:hypothetical protein
MTTLLETASVTNSPQENLSSSSSLHSSLLTSLMSYALLPIDKEIPFKTCLALDSIATLLSSKESPPLAIINLLLHSKDSSSLSPLLLALQSILLARHSQGVHLAPPDQATGVLNAQKDDWVFDLISMIIEKILVATDAQTSETLILEIVTLCGKNISSFLVSDVMTLLYSTLLHSLGSLSLCWDLKSLHDTNPSPALTPIQTAWESILPVIFSTLFPATPSTDIVVFKAGWILTLVISKVSLFSTPPSPHQPS